MGCRLETCGGRDEMVAGDVQVSEQQGGGDVLGGHRGWVGRLFGVGCSADSAPPTLAYLNWRAALNAFVFARVALLAVMKPYPADGTLRGEGCPHHVQVENRFARDHVLSVWVMSQGSRPGSGGRQRQGSGGGNRGRMGALGARRWDLGPLRASSPGTGRRMEAR